MVSPSRTANTNAPLVWPAGALRHPGDKGHHVFAGHDRMTLHCKHYFVAAFMAYPSTLQGGSVATHPHLPPPLWSHYAWQVAGACRHHDTHAFFLESERGQTREIKVAEAKALCATCPVQGECRSYGINAQEPYGIWGGLTAQERKRR